MFTKRCNAIIQFQLHKIHLHPFNQGLKNGTLSKEIFHAFLRQDRVYLRGLAQTHRSIANRLSDEKKQLFLTFSKSALDEIKTIDYYLEPSAQTDRFFQKKEHIHQTLPLVNEYICHMMTQGRSAPIEVAIASVLPCFLIYSQLGQIMQAEPVENNPFQKWIDSYASTDFLVSANQLVGIAEASAGNSQNIESMLQAFRISTHFEIAFWDAMMDLPVEELQKIPAVF